MKKSFLILLLLVSAGFAGAQQYKLVWEDQFDQAILDEKVWTIEVDSNGGGNQEYQYYRKENISVGKHPSGAKCLIISAKKQNLETRLATSGRLVTRNKVAFRYGKIEARIALPKTANGLWPAFWLMGDDINAKGWPRCGEIDVLEMGNWEGIKNGTQDKFFNGACHWGEKWTFKAKNSTAPYSLQDGFHLFTLIWDKKSLKMYLDLDKYPKNEPYFTLDISGDSIPGNTAYYFHKPFSILFNLAVGGIFTGIKERNEFDSKITALPADGSPVNMYVDYVKIYQKNVKSELLMKPHSK